MKKATSRGLAKEQKVEIETLANLPDEEYGVQHSFKLPREVT